GQAVRQGRALISFCDNDYLGLAHDPRMIAAAQAAATEGAGAGASRLVTGDHPLNHAIETKLAAMKGLPAARLFGSGYLANIGVIPCLVGPGDRILLDELAHACMHSGAKLSGAAIETFGHNDLVDLDEKLAATTSGQCLVLTETVFSMDGDLAPLDAMQALCERRGAWLMTDDAHGFGVVQQSNPAPVQMGTLSKAVGAYGGYVCGPQSFIDLLVSRARSFVYTTGLPPAVLGAIDQALEIIAAEPDRGGRAIAHAARFCQALGLPAPQSPIVPIIVGAETRALEWSAELEARGLLVTAIRPPTVPDGTARLRITFSAAHKDSDVDTLIAALKTCMAPA
ncbi:MAG: 8-amino-7-oxononanoate synthase, partial [Pseudomonadota bacterium]